MSNFSLQVNLPGMIPSTTKIIWALSPLPSNSSAFCLPNGVGQNLFVVNPSCLKQGTIYNASVTAIYTPTQTTVWTSGSQIVIPTPPFGGSLLCTPKVAQAYQDIVFCNASNWTTFDGLPAKYQYFTINRIGSMSVLTPSWYNSVFSNFLPPATVLYAKVSDSYGAFNIT